MNQDLESLQGTWTVKALEVDGQAMPEVAVANGRIVVERNRFTSTGMGAVYQGTIELDTTQSPRHLDMKFDAGPEKGNTNLCIYELNGETWKLCIAMSGTVRPSSFATTPGSGFALETLIRGGAAIDKTPGEAADKLTPATEFEGEWQMVSGIMDGRAMDESTVSWVKRITRGNRTTVKAGPQTIMQVDFTHDPTQSPQTIDYVNTAGAHKGKGQHGIYKWDGNVFTICVAGPGADRPADFEPGRGRTLTVWKRA